MHLVVPAAEADVAGPDVEAADAEVVDAAAPTVGGLRGGDLTQPGHQPAAVASCEEGLFELPERTLRVGQRVLARTLFAQERGTVRGLRTIEGWPYVDVMLDDGFWLTVPVARVVSL